MPDDTTATAEPQWEPRIVAFLCNWCSYAGADTAGVARMAYPPNARIIRTMCSARVNIEFVWYAFKMGAPVVLVSGCHYVDCHYIDANRSTVRRVDGLWNGLEKAGLRPDRLMLEWCSAAEGARWQTIMEAVEAKRQSVDGAEIDRTRVALEKAKVPRPQNPRSKDENAEAGFVCMRCDNQWQDHYRVEMERICPECRSNSVRWLKRS